jgi:predicted nucleic acid-binding protein
MAQPRCLVDTNVLLRLANNRLDQHRLCAASVDRLRQIDYLLLFTFQNLTEFWNVSTRPAERNGHGLSAAETADSLNWIERTMVFLPDESRVLAKWRRLIVEHQVRGVQVHDARLAASLIVHEVPQILTLNGPDFARYPEIEAIHPASLL